MSDLISRQAAIDAIEEYSDRLQMVNWQENQGVPYKAYALNWAVNTIRDLPSAHPEVIRCHECSKRRTLDCPMGITVFDAPPSDGYCYKAERRNDG